MDRNNPEEEQVAEEQQNQQNSSVDRVNNLINKGRSTYNNAKRAKKIYKGVKTARGALAAGQAAGASGSAVAGAAATSEVWVPVLAIVGLILLVVVVVVVIILMIFSNNPTPTCASLTASSDTTSASTPVILTLNDCSPNATFKWSSSVSGGTFSPTNAESTSYTPPDLTVATPVEITATICSSVTPSLCSSLSIELTITKPTCQILGGTCMASGICSAEGQGTYAGGLADCRQDGSANVCCNLGAPSGDVHFYCQYGAVNSRGNIVDQGVWNYRYNGKFCSISSGTYNGTFYGSKGCAPTSIAMALTSLGYTINPEQVSKANPSYDMPSRNIGCQSPGTSTNDMNYGVRRWVNRLPGGYSMTGDLIGSGMTVGVLRTMDTYIKNGCFIVAGANVNAAQNSGWTGFIGHAFLISGVDVAGRDLTVYDPTFCEGPGRNTGGKRTLTNVTTISSVTSGNHGFFNAYAICK
jgi:hypothetical protein